MVQDFTEQQLIAPPEKNREGSFPWSSFGWLRSRSNAVSWRSSSSGTVWNHRMVWGGCNPKHSGFRSDSNPLANLAFKRGRRVSLAFGAFLAILGAAMMILATYTQSFPVEIVALLFLGAGSAVSLQARFAAADIPTGKPKGRDLSLVVWATTLGAVIGPNLIAPGESLGLWLGMPHLAGPFLFTIAAQLSSTLVFWFGLRPDPLIIARDIAGLDPKQKNASLKDALEVVREFPLAGYAVLTIALSHMVMVSVMSMTPAHLNAEGHSLADVGFTISLHVAGMYSLAPVFGWLTDKFGAIRIVVTGQFISLTSLAVSGFWQSEFYAVVLGLFLLGVGWSASTVAASALLSETLATGQRSKVQGFSDSLMNLSGAFGGAISGIILTMFTFGGLNAAALLPVVFIALATSYSKKWR